MLLAYRRWVKMVAGIAHEVNQPLYSIINYARAVKNIANSSSDPNSDKVQQLVDQILKCASRGGEVTKRLRSFVKRQDANRRELCCSDIVRESLEFVREEAKHSQIQLSISDETSRQRLILDRVQIQQVLVNLLKNSMEAMREHHTENPRIHISVESVRDGVKVSVHDNGPGIPESITEDVFEAFCTTKKRGGRFGTSHQQHDPADSRKQAPLPDT